MLQLIRDERKGDFTKSVNNPVKHLQISPISQYFRINQQQD